MYLYVYGHISVESYHSLGPEGPAPKREAFMVGCIDCLADDRGGSMFPPMSQQANGETKGRAIDGKKALKISFLVDKKWAKGLGEILLLNFSLSKQFVPVWFL